MSKSRKGFASLSKEKQREIASMGGKAAHAMGKAHEWTAEEAQINGRKGGRPKGWRKHPPITEEKQEDSHG